MNPSKRTLFDKELDELYSIVAKGEARGARIGKYRRVAAYILKIIAAGSSLVIATGMWPSLNQGFGIATLLAVLLDSVSSNHKRLIAEVEAGYAYESLRHNAKTSFNSKLAVLQAKFQQRGQDLTADDGELIAIQQEAHTLLSKGVSQIRERLAKVDIEALKELSLEHERAATAR